MTSSLSAAELMCCICCLADSTCIVIINSKSPKIRPQWWISLNTSNYYEDHDNYQWTWIITAKTMIMIIMMVYLRCIVITTLCPGLLRLLYVLLLTAGSWIELHSGKLSKGAFTCIFWWNKLEKTVVFFSFNLVILVFFNINRCYYDLLFQILSVLLIHIMYARQSAIKIIVITFNSKLQLLICIWCKCFMYLSCGL